MAIIRVKHNKENPYVMLNKDTIQNKQVKLSLRARGLWALLLSYPDDWKFYVKKLASECIEGKAAIYATIDELMKAKLMIRVQYHKKKSENKLGGTSVEYVVFESPLSDEQKDSHERELLNSLENSRDSENRNVVNSRETDLRDLTNQQLLSNEVKLNTDVVVVKADPPPVNVGMFTTDHLTKDDIYHFCLRSKKDWTSEEMESAWAGYSKKDQSLISDKMAYFEGIIQKQRALSLAKQTKPKLTHEEKKQCQIEKYQAQKKRNDSAFANPTEKAQSASSEELINERQCSLKTSQENTKQDSLEQDTQTQASAISSLTSPLRDWFRNSSKIPRTS